VAKSKTTRCPLQTPRRGCPGAARGKSAIYHGQGGGVEHEKADITAYFRIIEQALGTLLHEERAPLLFAGVDFLFPLYREVNSYAYFVEEPVPRNPAQWSAVELHRHAMPL
jgi:hypothetical protein